MTTYFWSFNGQIDNSSIVEAVKQHFISLDPKLDDPEYRKNLPIEEKKKLVIAMIKVALANGARPVRPISI